ncbi:hypothetical protein [Arthrobacter sp. zg-Y769]|uniref:hypothetical protein n=1 Tax=Arthrobacter sp. zg-Y769 TaxID=2894191 RepID=UPI001E5FBB5F|nr:hypothetical protein [Arthrobacter sp. zg-Y769]MCC9203586.1 hypothetical protein [Arthrobacter sp. zg-Y769]
MSKLSKTAADSGTDDGGIGRKQASGVGVASLLAAASGFLILFIAARALSPADNAEFLAYWAGLFAVIGILAGVTAETTRGVGTVAAAEAAGGSATGEPAAAGQPAGARVMVSALIVGGTLAVLVLALGLPFADELFSDHGVAIVLLLALTSVVFAAHAAVAGSLQGRALWGPFSLLLTLEALFRFVAVLLAAVLGGALFGIEVACLAALLAWLVVLASSRPARAAALSRADIPLVPFLRQTGHALLSAAASAALLVSFPLLVKLTTSTEDYDLAAPLLLAVSLTRAPIMLPLQAFQGLAITSVIRARDEGLKALRKPIAAVAGLGVVGAGLAALIGPWIMLFFGQDYHVSRWVLAALTLAAAVIALLTLTGTGLLAMGKHRSYAVGWVVASVAAFICLLLPFSTEVRCVLALFAGPLLGIAVHLAALPRKKAAVQPV